MPANTSLELICPQTEEGTPLLSREVGSPLQDALESGRHRFREVEMGPGRPQMSCNALRCPILSLVGVGLAT